MSTLQSEIMLKYINCIFFTVLFVQISSGQSDTIHNYKHSIGMETSIARFSNSISKIKSGNNLGFSANKKTGVHLNLKYQYKANNYFRTIVLGNYINNKDEFILQYNEKENNEVIQYTLKTKLNLNQYNILILEEIGFGKSVRFFLQVGAGLGHTKFKEFSEGYLAVLGLDDDFKRIKLPPEVKSNFLSYKISLGIGCNIIYDSGSIDFGYRYMSDFKNKLNSDGLYFALKIIEFYIGGSIFIK